jgi:hypothetical protein
MVLLHTLEGALPQIDVATTITACDVVIGLITHTFAQRMLVDWQIVVAHQVQPLDDIFAAIAPRHSRCIADAEIDLATGDMQVLSDLTAGLTATNHQHRSLGKLGRIAVQR